jgi:hypothetical protein
VLVRGLERFRRADERRGGDRLQRGGDEAGRDAGDQRGREDAPRSAAMGLVAGEGERVPPVVRRRVQRGRAGEPRAEHQERAQQDRGERGHARRLGGGEGSGGSHLTHDGL